jgi:hypothetical protein
MQASTRERVAEIVGAAGAIHVSGSSSGQNGQREAQDLSFCDQKTNGHVSLKLTGNRFSGFDGHTSHHFAGTISDSIVSLYDCQDSQHHFFRTKHTQGM